METSSSAPGSTCPNFDPEPVSMILWEIGNHGGGPSRDEYRSIKEYARQHPEYEFIDSTIDRFFDDVLAQMDRLPVVQSEIQDSFPGCYTSMSRVKRGYREAESLMVSAERLATLAWWWGRSPGEISSSPSSTTSCRVLVCPRRNGTACR